MNILRATAVVFAILTIGSLGMSLMIYASGDNPDVAKMWRYVSIVCTVISVVAYKFIPKTTASVQTEKLDRNRAACSGEILIGKDERKPMPEPEQTSPSIKQIHEAVKAMPPEVAALHITMERITRAMEVAVRAGIANEDLLATRVAWQFKIWAPSVGDEVPPSWMLWIARGVLAEVK